MRVKLKSKIPIHKMYLNLITCTATLMLLSLVSYLLVIINFATQFFIFTSCKGNFLKIHRQPIIRFCIGFFFCLLAIISILIFTYIQWSGVPLISRTYPDISNSRLVKPISVSLGGSRNRNEYEMTPTINRFSPYAPFSSCASISWRYYS